MPEKKKDEHDKALKKSEFEWKPDKSQILTIEESLQKDREKRKKE